MYFALLTRAVLARTPHFCAHTSASLIFDQRRHRKRLAGCNPNKIQYIAPAFPVVQPIVRDDPGPLGERVKNYASSLAGLNEGANCNVMIIQQETYSGEPDEISGYSRKETSNFESSNTFDIYIFDKATFTNTGDGAHSICWQVLYLVPPALHRNFRRCSIHHP